MKIDSSVIGMESERKYSSSTVRGSRFLVKDAKGGSAHGTGTLFGNLFGGDEDSFSTGTDNGKKNGGQDVLTASTDAMMKLQERVDSMRMRNINLRTSGASALDNFRQMTLRSILNMFFGNGRMSELFGDSSSYDFSFSEQTYSVNVTNLQRFGISANTLTLQNQTFYDESESTSFTAKGKVKTADGREIDINLDIGMSRRFTKCFEEEMQIMRVNSCDPLVLNFDGNAAELTDQKFFFDIDGDGTKDEISRLSAGSGYLALDKNGDGIINDGKELFGPNTGSGFEDLAAYDEDGNGWIDENDSVWSKLKIWCHNADGTETLCTLAEKGVGAISLQNVNTDFALNNMADNSTKGNIRSTGIFLYENGGVGTVQHVDVAKAYSA